MQRNCSHTFLINQLAKVTCLNLNNAVISDKKTAQSIEI